MQLKLDLNSPGIEHPPELLRLPITHNCVWIFYVIFLVYYVLVLCLHVYVYHMHAWCPHEGQKKALYSLELELNSGEPPYGLWELNPGHLQEQLFSTAEPSLWSLMLYFTLPHIRL